LRGPALLVAGIFLFTLLDVNSKLLSGTYGVGQVILLRHVALLAAFGIARLCVPGAGGPLRTAHPRLHLVRAIAMVFSAGGFFLAFRQIPLAEGYLVFFTAPFLSLGLAALLLRERVPPAAWLWVAVGFAGVAATLVPKLSAGSGGWFAYAAALAGTAAYAVVLTINRKLRHERGVARLIVWPSLLGLLVFGPAAALDWEPPPPGDLALLLVNGLFAGIAVLCLAIAFRHATVARLAPFEFVGLPLSVFWDWALWGLPPAASTLAGGAVVVLACVMSERAQRAPSGDLRREAVEPVRAER
jgi:drug/metabolite transporter (DMT)-like permease